MNVEQRIYDTLPTGTAFNEAASSVSWASQGQGILSQAPLEESRKFSVS